MEVTKSAAKESVSNEVDLGLREASLVSGRLKKRVFEPETRRINSRRSLSHTTPTKIHETKLCPQTAPRRIAYSAKVVTDKTETSPMPEKNLGDQEQIVDDEQVVTTNSDECLTPDGARKPFPPLETKAGSVTCSPSEENPIQFQSPLANGGLSAVKQSLSHRKAPVSRKSFPYITPSKKDSLSHAGVRRSAPRPTTISTCTNNVELGLTSRLHRTTETPQSLKVADVLVGGEIGCADREPTEGDIIENGSISDVIDEDNSDSEFHCAADRTLPFAQEQASTDSADDQTDCNANTVTQEIAFSNESLNSILPCQVSPAQCSTPTARKSLLHSVESPAETITTTPIQTATPCESGDYSLASEHLPQLDMDKSNEEEDSALLKDQDECVNEKHSPYHAQQVTPQNVKPLSRPFGGPLATSTPLVHALKQHPSINNRLIEGDDISNSMMEGVWEGDTSIATVDYGDSTIIDEDLEGDDDEDMLEKWRTGSKFEFPKRQESSRPCSLKVVEDADTLSPPIATPEQQQEELNPDLELSLFGPGPPEINENGIEDSEISELHEWEVGQVDDEIESYVQLALVFIYSL